MLSPFNRRQQTIERIKDSTIKRPIIYYKEKYEQACKNGRHPDPYTIAFFEAPSDNLNPDTSYKSPLLDFPGVLHKPDYEGTVDVEINEDQEEMINADKLVILPAVKNHPSALLYTPKQLLNDFNFAMKLIKLHNGTAYIFLSDNLQKDPRILTWIIQNYPERIYYVDTNVPDYDMYVCHALQKNERCLGLIPLEVRNNEKYVQLAIKHNGNALQYAYPKDKKNKALVLRAVQNNGLSLQYADPELQADYEVVAIAVEENGNALQYASPELKENISIVIIAMVDTQDVLQYVSDRMKSHPEIIAFNKVVSNKRKREE